MLGALVLAPVLLLADIWHSPQLNIVHRHPLVAAVGALIALAAVAGTGLVIVRWPAVLGCAAVVALPFRIPIEAGGVTSNLLVPLYFVVAAGSVAFILAGLRGRSPPRHRSPRPATAPAATPSADGAPAAADSAAARASRARPLARVAAGGLRRPVRAPGGLLAEVHDRVAAGRVLLRAVCARVLPAAQARLDSAANPDLPGARCRARGGVRAGRVRRVRDQDDLPEPEADRRQSGSRLLHGQLGVLRSEHLRSVPRARDDPAGRGDSVRAPAADAR